MFSLLRHRLRRQAWIACIAIFGLAFAPTISHALAHANGDSAFDQICTPQGMKQASATAGESGRAGAPSAGGGHLEHCPLCGLGATAWVAPSPQPLLLPERRSQPLPALFLHAPRPLFAWTHASPRAPPAQV